MNIKKLLALTAFPLLLLTIVVLVFIAGDPGMRIIMTIGLVILTLAFAGTAFMDALNGRYDR